MASRKPLTQVAGLLEQLQAVDTLTVGDYDLPNAISDDGKVLVTVNSAAVWEFYSHADLSNITVDDHHNQTHTHNGTDDSGVVEHSDTANITVDDHHDQTHTHNGLDSSGVVEHDDTANGTIANHDTSATGTELDTLTDGSNADALHIHTASTLSGNVTYYLSTGGNDSTGTGNVSAPWAHISRALDEINLYTFEKDAIATIVLADGTYEMREVLVIKKDIPHIVITGTTLSEYTISAVTAVAFIGSAIWDITFTVNTTTGMSTDDFLAIRAPTAGRIYNGGWEIRDVISGTSVKVRIDTPLVVPGTGGLADITAWIAPTIIETIDPIGLNILWDHVQITKLTFKQGAGGDVGLQVGGVGDVLIGPNVVCNGYTNALVVWGGFCGLETFYASDCVLSVRPYHSAGLYAEDSTFAGNITGIQTFSSSVWLEGCYLTGNSFAGLSIYQGGSLNSNNTDYVGNGIGVWADSESFAIVTAGAGNTFAVNTTDLSPAANTEGNSNSYMKG